MELLHVWVIASGALRAALKSLATASLCHHLSKLMNHLEKFEAVVRIAASNL
jgi:hypothetical protein